MSSRTDQDITGQTDWVQIRSRWDPAFWAPLLLTVLVVTPLFICAHDYTSEVVDNINASTLSDPETSNQLILCIRVIVWPFSAILIIFSILNLRYFKAGIQEGRLPPTGWWSLGAWRAIVGPRVKRMAPIGYAISLLLFITGIGLAIVVEYFLLQVGKV